MGKTFLTLKHFESLKKTRDAIEIPINTFEVFYFFQCLHVLSEKNIFEPPHDKTNRMACAPREDSDQPGHPRHSTRLISFRCPHEETLVP